MATRIADTLGRMGSGDYPLVYAKDIEFEDGQDLQSFIDTKQDKFQMINLPALKEEIDGRVYQYVGNTTSRFTNCHFYKAHSVGAEKYWEEVEVVNVPKDIKDLTDATGIVPKDVSDLSDTNKLIPKDIADLPDASGVIPTDVSDLEDESGLIPSEFEDLSDVNVADVSNGQVIGWDETTQTWKNIDQTGGGIIVDDEISDTSINPVQNKVIKGALDNKVDVVAGKQLSTEDFTTEEKNKLANAVTDISGKVDKVPGKQLSTEDYTTAEKEKVANAITDVSDKQDIFQYTTMPTASQELLDKVVQYIGESTEDYYLGFVYRCEYDGLNYFWRNIPVQTVIQRHGIVNPTSGFVPDRGYLMFGEGFGVSDDENANQTVIEQYELTNADIAEIMAVLN